MDRNDVPAFEAVYIKEELMISDEETEESKTCKIEQDFLEDVEVEYSDTSETESTVSMVPFSCISCKAPLDNPEFSENVSHDGKYLCLACFKILQSNLFEALKCIKCNDLFADFNQFQKHHSKCCKLYKCIHCQKEFTKEHLLLIHSKYHELPEPFKCDRCGLQFYNLYLFNLHLICHGDEKHFFTCKLCDRVFKYRYNLIFHSFTHLGKNLICPNCDNTECKTLTDLNRHKLEFHLKKFECTLCKETFGSINLRREHLVDFHSVKIRNRRFKCTNCDLFFSCVKNLEAHLLEDVGCEKKQGCGWYVCEFCGKKFKNLAFLRFHSLYHKNNLFKCTFCKKKFINEKEIQLHRCYKEKGKKISEMKLCNVCYRYFQSERELTKHRSAHNVRKIQYMKVIAQNSSA